MATSVRSAALKSSLLPLAAVLFLGVLEAGLRTGRFDDLDKPRPAWIPPSFKEADRAVMDANRAAAAGNPFRFTDAPPDPGRPKARSRVVVLGDSFIWGDGIPYEQTWPHVLRARLSLHRPGKVEVLSWGLCGWGTAHQLVFLEKKGEGAGIDTVLVGFVSNDPDMLVREQRRLDADSPPWAWLGRLFPNAVSFLCGHADAVLSRFLPEWGYENWEDGLYTRENLERYEQVLSALKAWCGRRGIRLAFLLTPNADFARHRKFFALVIPLLKKHGIEYRDLLPAAEERFRGRPERSLWANPANPHPGREMHEFFAEEAESLLADRPARVLIQ